MNSPIRYFVGKGNGLGKSIISYFPEGYEKLNYLEAFGGSGSILFQKEPSCIEIYNDLESNVHALFKVLTNIDLFEEFKDKCDITYYSKDILDEFRISLDTEELSDLERAYKYFIVNRTAYNGVGGFSAALVVRRNMSKSISDFLSTIDRLPEIHQRLSRVIVHNTNGTELIKKYDKKDWFFYLDPPYHHSTRTSVRYNVDMNNEEQEEFLDTVIACKHAKIIISGYDCKEYDRLIENGWRKESWEVNTQSSKRESKTKIETVWMNYE